MTRYVIVSSLALSVFAAPAAAQLNVSSAQPTRSAASAASPVMDAAVKAYQTRMANLEAQQARQASLDGGVLTADHDAAFAAQRQRIERRLTERARRNLPLTANADGSRAF